MTPSSERRDWFIIAEDSARLFPTASIQAIQYRLRHIPPGIEILQTGYRRTVRHREMKLLDLDTMQFIDEVVENKVMKSMGQKLFIATRRGVKLLLHRLLKGKQDYFDTCMCQLIRANVAFRDDRPMAGSRAHYSLVDGGKLLIEEMPAQGKLADELRAEILP